MESNPYYRRGPNLQWVLPGCLLPSTLQLPKESVMSLWEHYWKGLYRNLPKNPKISYNTTKKKKSYTHNITKEGEGGHQNPQGRCLLHGPNSRQGVALVVMDRSQYVNKCIWALLHDTKVYKPCKRHHQKTVQRYPGNPQTAQQRTWIFQNILVEQTPLQQIAPHSNLAPRFYGLPKLHKANCPMQPIVSACGHSNIPISKIPHKILQKYTGITHSFVKDSKGFSQYLRSLHIEQDEELVSFWCFSSFH